MKWLLRVAGRNRLHGGFCPWCYSSPPRPNCPVCHGDHRYGTDADPDTVTAWRRRFGELLDTLY